jgi:hypothetical protein
MKKLVWMTAVVTTLTALAASQLRAQDRLTVPFPSSTQPRKLVVDSMGGSVTVRGYDGQEVVVESSGGNSNGRPRKGSAEPPPGMHRIGPSGGELQATTDNNTIKINSGFFGGPSNMTIQVPRQTSVSVKTMTGREIVIENVSGEIEANNMNGAVNIVNVSGSVVAHSMNGKVTATLNTVMPDKAMSFSTMNGDIDVTLPSAIKANVKMKTDRGDMFTDFDIQLNPSGPSTTIKSGRSVRVRTDRTTTGSINGGGAEIQFTSFNGDIVIHKK